MPSYRVPARRLDASPGEAPRLAAPALRQSAAQTLAWAALLERFYVRSGLPAPVLHVLKGEQVPQPYKRLLVHSSDMTPTLESFYRQPMSLSVLSREHETGAYLREVVLNASRDGRPVEYGVIRIMLDRLPASARARVLQEERPLGNILQSEAVAHLSWPQAFFRTASDSHTAQILGLTKPATLYGRRNVLLDACRHLLAEVIELLAPAETDHA